MKTLSILVFVFCLIVLGANDPSFAQAEEKDDSSIAACCAVKDLLPPVRLMAAGEFIDTGECIAHSGPHLLDLDGDGLQDLLVGDFSGHIHFFKNTATNAAPVYAAGKALETKGEPIRVSNW
jgi:hypothetical protein